MRKVSFLLFAALLLIVPLFYHPAFPFPDQAKRDLLWIWLPLVFLLGPVAEALQGRGFVLAEPRAPILAWLGLSLLGLLGSPSLPYGVLSATSLALGIGIASTVAGWKEQARREGTEPWRPLFGALLLSGGLAALLGLIKAGVFDGTLRLLGIPAWEPRDIVSTFGNSNHAAEFLAPVASAAFCLSVLEKGWRGRACLAALFFLSAFLAVARVRAGAIAAAAGALAGAILLLRGSPRAERIRLLAPSAALLLGFLLPFARQEDPFEADPQRRINTVEVRKRIYLGALRMIAERPLLGWGTGSFPVAFPPFRDPEEILLSTQERGNPSETEVAEPHNDYLLVGAELGIPGILVLGLLGALILKNGKRAAASGPATAAFAGIVAIGANALFRSPLSNPSAAFEFWLLLGVLFSEIEPPNPLSPRAGKTAALLLLPLLLLVVLAGVRGFGSELCLAFARRAAPHDKSYLFQEAVDLDPHDPKKREILAMELWNRGEMTEARKSLEKLLSIHPNHFAGRMRLGQILFQTGERAAGWEELRRAEALDPENPRLDRSFALAYASEKDDLRAIDRLRSEIRHHGDPAALREVGAQVEKEEGQERALKYYQAHIVLRPGDAAVWFAMGQIFRNLGDEEEAGRHFGQTHRLYGVEHLHAGRPEDAERQFRLFRKFASPEDPLPDLFLAATALASGQRPEAEAALRSLAARGVRQERLREPGLETLAADPELRGLLLP